jgi:outer membrane protein
MEESIRTAIRNNGNLSSAYSTLKILESQKRAARAPFLPQVTPSYSYSTGVNRFETGTARGLNLKSRSTSLNVNGSWLLLDNGARKAEYQSSDFSYRGQVASTRNTLRNILFQVHQQYYEVLRSEKLVSVQDSQKTRTARLLEQTDFRIQIGDAAKKDHYQVAADDLNAKVNLLTASNRLSTARATMKALIGWQKEQALPPLASVETPPIPEENPGLDALIQKGLLQRPDLVAQREDLKVQGVAVRLAQLDGGVNYSLTANTNAAFAQDVSRGASLRFEATFPLFDGARSKERIKQSRYRLESQKHLLEQSEREAQADIESAYAEYVQNKQRLSVAEAAYAAAKVNYDFVFEGHDPKLGETSLTEVIVAQATLVTAESNRVEALFDYLISDVRLKLVSGEPVEGEELATK